MKRITILGGGPAGLAAGYYAKKAGFSFTIYEAADRVGGNCITLEHGDFRFDSGAHRFHDKDLNATKEIKQLLGKDLKKIDIPSRIFSRGKFVDFPLSPLNLLRNVGVFTFSKAAVEVLKSRLQKNKRHLNFETFALQAYGPTLARRFLLNYSEKLWGLPCTKLSPDIAGKRMKGLNLKTFIKEAFSGNKAKTEHLDGSFYYPDRGIGGICDKLAQFCDTKNIRLHSKVTKVFHDSRGISAVEINKNNRVNLLKKKEESAVISTLPLNDLLQMMEPLPPEHILRLSKKLKYRNVILMAVLLNTDKATRAATVYFPEADYPFTRLYEPKNRSTIMAPKEKTSLILEIPCQKDGRLWNMAEEELKREILPQLLKTNLINEEQIIDTLIFRMVDAYPVLAEGYKEKVKAIFTYLGRFQNLKLTGRNGKFVYSHVHDMMKFARAIFEF